MGSMCNIIQGYTYCIQTKKSDKTFRYEEIHLNVVAQIYLLHINKLQVRIQDLVKGGPSF